MRVFKEKLVHEHATHEKQLEDECAVHAKQLTDEKRNVDQLRVELASITSEHDLVLEDQELLKYKIECAENSMKYEWLQLAHFQSQRGDLHADRTHLELQISEMQINELRTKCRKYGTQ